MIASIGICYILQRYPVILKAICQILQRHSGIPMYHMLILPVNGLIRTAAALILRATLVVQWTERAIAHISRKLRVS